ncbi:dihydroxyacetone kinase family protein [Lentzea tibetensis]|uniref:Dihydroxyacetone kinase family protein n=1 Tax=Lentzea tibetensis TaxID=2591470 RepID=A0A563F1J1_9PSEU|nr:dihydroxyacetone kinase family protein [Lentzea tibetensis]TWP53608.1 dihydroxyacetone kinase family protein [Lentzea tibetensis]
MTFLFNEPTTFADELIDGFVAAHDRWVRRVEGGVVRAQRGEPGTVAVVIGGGSGHYPAFGGLVGPGLAHGAAMGNLFASPSARQVCSVARAAETGAGVLFTFGNYAGDVLHFGQAQESLVAQGIPCHTVTVTDDVSSASADRLADRRGVAGGLIVFKVAGTAADAGHPLDEVARVAELANSRTRTMGVAFTGCTLPGAAEPLFSVAPGRMAVGMGVHGEPGISEQDVPTADGLAELLVGRVLAEKPLGVTDTRVAVVLNGLGSVKYEELFVVYSRVARLLAAAGVTVVEPEVGEFFTSFDMAGVSLSVCWLDDELEGYWRAPADTPAYRKVLASAATVGTDRAPETRTDQVPAASEASQRTARRVLAAFDVIRRTVDDNADELGRIDAIAGDGDHGIGMQRGATAALAAARHAVDLGAGAGTVLERAADAWADKAGGTSGALWGVALHALGAELGDEAKPTPSDVVTGVCAAEAAIVRLGKAELGDKTMVDVLVPFRTELAARVESEVDLAAAWSAAADVAEAAAEATASLVPRIGRARPHAERSVGSPDAGAVSLALIVRAVSTVLGEGEGQ